VNEGYTGWRALARRQWPLALVLAALLAGQITAWRGMPASQWLQLPGDLIVCATAVISLRRPFDAALVAAFVMAATAGLLWLLGVPRFGADAIMLAAGMALIAIVVRLAPRRRATTGAALVILGYAFSSVVRHDRNEPTASSAVFLVWAIAFGIAVGTGLYFRARDSERRRAEEASVAAAQQAERLALARELHDVVAHYVTGIVVHSQGAQAIADQDPDAARTVLPIITASGHEALAAMRRLVGTLRGTEPTATSRDNDELTDQIRKVADEPGGPVRLTVDLTDQVPPALARSILRLVQESVTNARKHAAGVTRIDVDVRTSGDAVHVRVTDDGTGQLANPAGGSGGFGLVGMRERVELLGGRFDAGPGEVRGWRVSAELPLASA
jgi:signal transduction histidine kinase